MSATAFERWRKRHLENKARQLSKQRVEVHRLRQLVSDPVAPSTAKLFAQLCEKNMPTFAFNRQDR